jgi:signal transduction histidine kinase/ligand-binding sensor domain-containing protein
VLSRLGIAAITLSACVSNAFALDLRKSLTQYTRSVWTQQQGLPQDTIRAIAQTTDGYLWLGTDDGLARFDGYDFAVFNKSAGILPSNSITALAAAPDGTLWIGTAEGLAHCRGKHFETFTVRQGLADNTISSLFVDRAGDLWIVDGVNLSRYANGKFTNFEPGPELPVTSFRAVTQDRSGALWVAGLNSVGRFADGKFQTVLTPADMNSGLISGMAVDGAGDLWVGSSKGAIERTPAGIVRHFDEQQGLPDMYLRAILVDHDGSVWAGTNGGLARLEGERFVTPPPGPEQVRCLFEDREGDLWMGSNEGLTEFRDDVFTIYGKSEDYPSDEPNVAFQDRSGRMWVGYHDSGLMMIAGSVKKLYTTRDVLTNNEIFSIRQTRSGDLLFGTRVGLLRLRDGVFKKFLWKDPLSRNAVFDAIDDGAGRVWVAAGPGLMLLEKDAFRTVIDVPPLLDAGIVTLCASRDGALWAGTYGKGLWRIEPAKSESGEGDSRRIYTTADGLSSDRIRSLYEDSDGTLWIATFGGGLDALHNGRIVSYTEKDGLLSDNIAKIEDDGESLWLSTTRGICRIEKQQLRDFAAGKRKTLAPLNYGVEDGLRSAQCAPAYPVGGGGSRTSDGRLWFTTSRGLAVFDPKTQKRPRYTPQVRLAEMTAGNDGKTVDLSGPADLPPGTGRVQFRYTAVHLSAPELVRYSYRLDSIDADWMQAGARRVQNYNSLSHGSYRFHVRAELPGGPRTETSYAFVVAPHYYETVWFRLACGLMALMTAWAAYQMRLRQIQARFAAVLGERARLAREIHDTLAQGFVGISSQLDAVAMCMPAEQGPAHKHLDMARRMARHSLTEARRSVMDLRASVLEGQDLASALESSTRLWTAGSGVEINVDVSGPPQQLPQEMEQHLLRIAQEAVTNVLKHAGASKIWIKLHTEAARLYLRVVDNGRGFDEAGAFNQLGGHFGLIGMRERAERLGGELKLASHPGEGTEVEVTAPLP